MDYSDAEDLRFALRGIDTVISTVTGPNQIQLIKAAVSSRVRRFAPAEFEGPPQFRSQNDPLDRSRASARYWLQYYQSSIQSTVFICGVFYERFQPGGLPQSLIALNTGYHGEGTYILDCARMSAELPALGLGNRPNVTICMTSVRDVANFVTKALSLPTWPAELHMVGERITVHNLAILVERLKSKLLLMILFYRWNTDMFVRAKVSASPHAQSEYIARRAGHCRNKTRLDSEDEVA